MAKKKKETHEIAKDHYIILWMKIRTRLPTENKALGSRSPGGPRERGGSVSQEFQASQPADQQGQFWRRGLGGRGAGFLFWSLLPGTES